MVKSRPVLHSEITQKAKDLLYKDYIDQPESYHLSQYSSWTVPLAFNFADVPGLKAVVNCSIPNLKKWKAGVQYSNDCVDVHTSFGSMISPSINFSGVTGGSIFSLGTDLSFDTTTRRFTKCNIGLSFAKGNPITALTMNDMGNNLNALCYYTLSPKTDTALGAKLSHCFLRNESTITIGTQHVLNSYTLVKTRVDTDGTASALVKLNWQSMFYLGFAGEVNVRRRAVVRFTLGVKP